jgi:secondary thiamine-phosphate synthase enzyme
LRTIVKDVDTSRHRFVDLTADLRSFVSGATDGLAHVFVPHATAGVAIFETGSGSEEDLAQALERLLPREDIYAHRHGSLGHGADHVVPAFISPSISIPLVDGDLALGTWQSVVLVDTNGDNPKRQVRFSLIEG